MREAEAKTKHCPRMIHLLDTPNHMLMCHTTACMMWEPEWKSEDKDIPEGEETPEGWHKLYHSLGVKKIRRFVEIDSGDCGLKTKECNHEHD